MSLRAVDADTAWSPAWLPDDPLDLLPSNAVVAVAMSGGVDSSVAAGRLAERGVRCVGITLAMWPRDRSQDRDRGCCSIDAVEDARRVAASLGIPHYAWNLEAGFGDAVIADFEAEYVRGRTPNPCVRCNERVKFGALLDRARAAGATHVATGHYARLGRRRGRVTLHRGDDAAKDQAYALYRVGQPALRAAVFPIGHLPSKAAVRAEAARMGLATASKPDSQELCFVDGDLGGHLARRLAGRFEPGEVVDEAGRVLGEHPGLPFYTVGQRGRLGIAPERPDAEPLFVLRLDRERNQVVAGGRPALLRTCIVAADPAWVDLVPGVGETCSVQLRAHAEPVAAIVSEVGRTHLRVRLDEAVAGVAPGQSMVVGRGDEVLGGGLIESSAA